PALAHAVRVPRERAARLRDGGDAGRTDVARGRERHGDRGGAFRSRYDHQRGHGGRLGTWSCRRDGPEVDLTPPAPPRAACPAVRGCRCRDTRDTAFASPEAVSTST